MKYFAIDVTQSEFSRNDLADVRAAASHLSGNRNRRSRTHSSHLVLAVLNEQESMRQPDFLLAARGKREEHLPGKLSSLYERCRRKRASSPVSVAFDRSRDKLFQSHCPLSPAHPVTVASSP